MPHLHLHKGLTFVLGGARSGKSRFAEGRVMGSGLTPVYIATARPEDEEMSERIAIHRDRRGKAWETVEEPLALADALRQSAHPGRAILIDCATLWITNLMSAGADVMREIDALVAALAEIPVPVVIVSNETGLGIVPDNQMAREFRDLAGNVNQRLAAVADEVYFVVAGLPLALKSGS